jgi:hypothetical protein
VIYSIADVWNHYSKVPPENSIYKGMALTDWPDEKKEPEKEEPKEKNYIQSFGGYSVGDKVKVDGDDKEYNIKIIDNTDPNDTRVILANSSGKSVSSVSIFQVFHVKPSLVPIKKFKVTHAERPDIPQVFKVGDKVNFRGKMYFVKYVNPEDKMVQIELAKIKHGKVVGVVTGAIVNVKPDTILPWGVTPNGKAISVGGDEWNQKTALRLEYDYAKVKPILEKIAAEAVGGEAKIRKDLKSWDDLGGDTQGQIEDKWKKQNYDSFYDSEVDNWRENDAGTDARRQVANDFNSGNTPDWAIDAIQEYMDDNPEYKEWPFDAHQIKKAMSIEGQYDDFSTGKIKVEFDDGELDEPKGYSKDQLTLPGVKAKEPYEYLTPDMREGITKAISDAFGTAADDVAENLDPPDYLSDSTDESLESYWDNMDDDEKYKFGKEQDIIPTEDDEESGELDQLPTKFDPLNETSGADYERTQALARLMSVERAAQILVERGLMKDIDNARDHIKDIDGQLWQSWKDSSTTTDGKILQVAAAEELGGRLHEHDGLHKKESIKDADYEFKSIGGFEGIKAYLRGKWETTQYLLDKADIQTMKVYRGIRWTLPFMGSKEEKVKSISKYHDFGGPTKTSSIAFTRYPNAQILRNGCQSCTTDAGVANGWTGLGDTSKVYRVVAPRTAALSIPAYGINIHSEHEVVLAGVAWQAYDVWKGKAPTFEQVPLDTSHMIEKMRNPYYPKVDKREMNIRVEKPGWNPKAEEYWKKYASQGQKPVESKSVTQTTIFGKDKGKSVEYKVGDLVKGGVSGNIYKIDKIGDTSVVFTVQKVGDAAWASKKVGDTIQDNVSSLGKTYKKEEKQDKTFKTSQKYQKSLDKFKIGQTVYSKYQSGKGYVITGFMNNGDLDVKEINLKTGNPTDHYAQLVPDLIYTSKEDAKTSPDSEWGKDD